nr:MAG: ORF1 [TTV-like mini virus]
MPFWNYRRRRPYRRRWFRTWRSGTAIRRRRWRKRRVRTTKRKLKRIIVKEWQPPNIRKCHIKGLCCLVYVNAQRLSFNSTMYEASTVPEHLPGGGGFCVMQFNLNNLYEMHKTCSNWWTTSNDNLPLCKYLGCTLTLYRAENVDYALSYITSGPGYSNKLTYPSCQPSMLLMRNNKIIMPSKKTKPRGKPYKKIRISPPPQFQTKWYFQKDLINKPLLILHAAPISLDHYYISTSSENTNITIKHLNTRLLKDRNWGNKKFETEHWPYKTEGTIKLYFYRYDGNLAETQTDNFLVKDICPLTRSIDYYEGKTPYEAKHTGEITNVSEYTQKTLQFRGNIFHKNNYTGTNTIYYSQASPQSIFKATITETTKLSENGRLGESTAKLAFTKLTDPIVTYTRYNPHTDTGESTKMYLLSNNKNDSGWGPPNDDSLILTGFPLWLNIFGFVDFQKRLNKLIGVDEQHLLCFETNHTNPKYTHVFAPIDDSFLNDQSPYLNYMANSDKQKWYPQTQYQTQTINNITLSGPGIAKLESRKSEEIKVKYDFYFKWGGSPAKMVTVENPSEQPIYPIPRTEYETPSLQSPAQNYETVVYSFDQRNYQLTRAAIERMQKDWGTKESLFTVTEPTREVPVLQTLQTFLQETQTQEKSQEEILLQLQQHKHQQLFLRQRILEMLSKIQQLE